MPATDQQTTELGYALPQGTDSPRQGDDAIRQNAKASAGWLIDLQTRSLVGTGSPVGVVIPSGAGVTYTDTAGTNGAWQWIATGTTSADWTVTVGDTGPRNVASLVSSTDWTVNNAVLRRVGGIVYFTFIGKLASSGTPTVLTLPAGYLPTAYDVRPLVTAVGDPAGVIIVRNNGAVDVGGTIPAGNNAYASLSWPTDQQWPAALPGTPA